MMSIRLRAQQITGDVNVAVWENCTSKLDSQTAQQSRTQMLLGGQYGDLQATVRLTQLSLALGGQMADLSLTLWELMLLRKQSICGN